MNHSTARAGLLRKEVAALLGVSTRTLTNWRAAGFGPRVHVDGGRHLYDRSDVEAFAAGVR